jgi:hypothetical protein
MNGKLPELWLVTVPIQMILSAGTETETVMLILPLPLPPTLLLLLARLTVVKPTPVSAKLATTAASLTHQGLITDHAIMVFPFVTANHTPALAIKPVQEIKIAVGKK